MSMHDTYDDLSLHEEDPQSRKNTLEIEEVEIKLYWRRWFILITFSFIIILNAFNLTEYFDVEETFIQFYDYTSKSTHKLVVYDVSYWLTLANLVSYFIFIFPAMYILDLKGIGFSCIIGTFLTIFGSWLKCASVRLDWFAVLIVGQILCAIAQSFIQCPLVKLSALWFGKNETATATSISILSHRIGAFLGFLIPPYVVETDTTIMDSMIQHFFYLYFIVGILCSFTFICSLFIIKNEPVLSANAAQLKVKKSRTECLIQVESNKCLKLKRFFVSLAALMLNVDYVLILCSFSILVGIYYSFSLHLNETIDEYYIDESGQHKGFMNLLLIGSGVVGSILSGLVLDYTKSFKRLLVTLYTLTLVSMIIFTTTLSVNIWFPIIELVLLGFFMTAYIPVGYELAVELTYPISEGTSSSLLNAGSIILGITFILLQKLIMKSYGFFFSNLFMCIFLFIGLVISCLMKSKLKRLNANCQ